MITTEDERNEIAERNQEQSSLLRLPPELRISIFELALDTAVIRACPLSTFVDWSDFHRVLPGFITACRQIYHESKPLLSRYSILEVASSRYFIGITKVKSPHVRKLKIYSNAVQQIMRQGQDGYYLKTELDRCLLRDSFPALETIEIPGDWKGYRYGEWTCEDTVQSRFKRMDLQITYHWDSEPELDLED